MEELHNKLNYISQQLEDLIFVIYNGLEDLIFVIINGLPYKITISQHIDKIQSCKLISKTFGIIQIVQRLVASLKNVIKIIGNVRASGRYLSGQASIRPYPFFEIYHEKDGYYNGQAIGTMFRYTSIYLYTNFIGCALIAVAVERMVFNQTSALYRIECWKEVEDIYSIGRNPNLIYCGLITKNKIFRDINFRRCSKILRFS